MTVAMVVGFSDPKGSGGIYVRLRMVPRRVTCALFWISVTLIFSGIILLVTSNHKGKDYESWGLAFLLLGLGILFVGVLFCIHACRTLAKHHHHHHLHLSQSEEKVELTNEEKDFPPFPRMTLIPPPTFCPPPSSDVIRKSERDLERSNEDFRLQHETLSARINSTQRDSEAVGNPESPSMTSLPVTLTFASGPTSLFQSPLRALPQMNSRAKFPGTAMPIGYARLLRGEYKVNEMSLNGKNGHKGLDGSHGNGLKESRLSEERLVLEMKMKSRKQKMQYEIKSTMEHSQFDSEKVGMYPPKDSEIRFTNSNFKRRSKNEEQEQDDDVISKNQSQQSSAICSARSEVNVIPVPIETVYHSAASQGHGDLDDPEFVQGPEAVKYHPPSGNHERWKLRPRLYSGPESGSIPARVKVTPLPRRKGEVRGIREADSSSHSKRTVHRDRRKSSEKQIGTEKLSSGILERNSEKRNSKQTPRKSLQYFDI